MKSEDAQHLLFKEAKRVGDKWGFQITSCVCLGPIIEYRWSREYEGEILEVSRQTELSLILRAVDPDMSIRFEFMRPDIDMGDAVS